MLTCLTGFAAFAQGKGADPDAPPPRLANGFLIEGKVSSAGPNGLAVQTPKGTVTYQWKHLSAGTRNRYEAAGKASKPGGK